MRHSSAASEGRLSSTTRSSRRVTTGDDRSICRAGSEIAPPRPAKRVARRVYAGDGCHRLARLRMAGVDVLEPDMLQGARRAGLYSSARLEHGPSPSARSAVGPTQLFSFLCSPTPIGELVGSRGASRPRPVDPIRTGLGGLGAGDRRRFAPAGCSCLKAHLQVGSALYGVAIYAEVPRSFYEDRAT